MNKEEFSGADIPARVDRQALEEQLTSIAPEASVRYRDQINWTVVDPVTGEESIETEPATLAVEGLPEGVGREAVLAVIEAHRPGEKSPGPLSVEDRLAALEALVAGLGG